MSPFFQQAPHPSSQAQEQLQDILAITPEEIFGQRKVTEWMLSNRPDIPKEFYEKTLQDILILMKRRNLSEEDYKNYLSTKKESLH